MLALGQWDEVWLNSLSTFRHCGLVAVLLVRSSRSRVEMSLRSNDGEAATVMTRVPRMHRNVRAGINFILGVEYIDRK